MITDKMKINSAISSIKRIQPFCTNQGFEITNKMCGINTLIWNYKQIANKICKINIDYFFIIYHIEINADFAQDNIL